MAAYIVGVSTPSLHRESYRLSDNNLSEEFLRSWDSNPQHYSIDRVLYQLYNNMWYIYPMA